MAIDVNKVLADHPEDLIVWIVGDVYPANGIMSRGGFL